MNKTIAIMQPYFLPYIGYWQLLNIADEFVIYDNIKYTKKGWINRNRYLCGSEEKIFSVPIAKGSDFLNVNERELSESFDKIKLMNQIKEAYRKAPYFDDTFSLFDKIVMFDEKNLFQYILNSVRVVAEYLNISTRIIVSSLIDIDHSLVSNNKVMAICKKVGACRYVNPIGGVEMYSKEDFLVNGIKLDFLRAEVVPYKQSDDKFIPYLSIIDVLMYNGVAKTRELLKNYNLE